MLYHSFHATPPQARMTEHESCNSPVRFDTATTERIRLALQHQQPQQPPQQRISLQASAAQLCGNGELEGYLRSQRFEVHPCEEVRARARLQERCQAFYTDLPPAYEELQVSSAERRYVGAGALPDLVHHVYNGDYSKVFRSDRDRPFRYARSSRSQP